VRRRGQRKQGTPDAAGTAYFFLRGNLPINRNLPTSRLTERCGFADA
jgi:hypothetical protein